MGKINFDSLTENLIFKDDLTIDDNFIICPARVKLSQEIIDTLKYWKFKDFECKSDISLGSAPQIENKIESKMEDVSSEDFTDSVENVSSAIKESLEEVEQNLKIPENTENSRLKSVQKVYNEYMEYINSVYTQYATHSKIPLDEFSATVRDLCNFIRSNKRYVLRVTPSVEARNKNFIVVHSMRSTVLALTIGMELHFPQSKLVELGMCCILHEIGMIRLPPQLYMTDKPLSEGEKAQIRTHPLIGFNIVKALSFPLSIQLGVLEHHEKENGTGYPRKLSGEKISNFAKIISVACSFEAITAPRQYKEAKTTFAAMVEMLRNENNQYNGVIIKALLYSLSLYPIGAYVYLKNGKVAVVTDVNPNNPKNPIIQILGENDSNGKPKTLNSDENENKIVRVLNKKEQEYMISTLKKEEFEKSEEKNQEKSFDSVKIEEFN